jgi:ABC-type dipeptide/oligopeptide/nickel transport system ATPase component
MVIIRDSEGKSQFNISERWYKFLMRCKYKIDYEDTQIVGILWGAVGCGKSIFAQKIARVISGTMTIEKIAFDKLEFIKAVLDSNKEVIIADEGIAIFFGRAAMTKEGRLMAELMAQIRQKNLFVLILVPDILSIDSMILSQASWVGYVYESRHKENGKPVLIKGNCDIYPQFNHNNHKDRIIRYVKLKRTNPLFREKKPFPFIREKGQEMTKTTTPFYVVDKSTYLQKKASVFDKYKKAFEKAALKPLRGGKIKDWEGIEKAWDAGMSRAEIRVRFKVCQSTLDRFINEKKIRDAEKAGTAAR